jgi:hypothetical protein
VSETENGSQKGQVYFCMTPITVNFSESESQLLAAKAKEAGITMEEFLHMSALSAASENESSFEDIKNYLLDRYKDVYRRLA